ncbi:hypothetical protein HW555_008796 [Spodoptera exigua]|uniref:Uncharacterized protein n=1 Tax=Spodoptera exigua TaxID=7107 RepID=A0A835L7G7_SPOEX|nr:hypothetical protein HW555_008796 [Spodoptera exigua]
MSRSKRYTQNGAKRIASTLRSVSCLCATDGGRPLHPPSADENEMRGTRRRAAVCAPVCVHGEITLVCVTRLPVCYLLDKGGEVWSLSKKDVSTSSIYHIAL